MMDGLGTPELQNPRVKSALDVPATGQAAPVAAAPEDPFAELDAADAALGLPPRARGLTAPADQPDFGDVYSAAWKAETIKTDAWGYREKMRRDKTLEMFGALPPEYQDQVRAARHDKYNNWQRFEYYVADAAQAYAASSPDAAQRMAMQPQSLEGFDDWINTQLRAEYDEQQAVLSQEGGGFAEFLGSSARAISDPTSIAMMPFGGPTGSVLKFAAVEAGLGALGEAAVLPREFEVAQQLDLPKPDVAGRLALGAAFGGALGGVIAGAPRVLAYGRARMAPIENAMREGESQLDATAAVNAAEAQMRGDTTIVEEIGNGTETSPLAAALAKPATAPAFPPIGPDAPPNWEQIRNGIFAGESGGDYNALFQFTNRKGGRYSRTKLTEMTVDQAIQFSRVDGDYGQWVESRIGKVSTPMGAYQIVGSTLRDVKLALGLQGDELMTPELQERMAHWIYRNQGTKAWEGYKGPLAAMPKFDPNAPAPNFGPTTRGYTGAGQVSTASGTRVDVEYQVVDLSTLFRARGDLQPRDRSRITSDAQIADMAARLEPQFLMPGPKASDGPPIVGPDNVIESGNGRFGAIERAYTLHPDRADAYRAAIEAQGFAVPEGVQRPVLIARRTSEMTQDQRVQFAIDAQDAGVAVMTATETAAKLARTLSPDVLMRFNPTVPMTDAGNGDFLRAALAKVPMTERNAMFDGSGILNKHGSDALREAMFARAWVDPDIVEMFTEADAGDLRGLLNALAEAVPEWAALRADIEVGLVRPEMDISGYVTDAVRLIATARRMARQVAAARKESASKISEKFTTDDAITELLDEVDLFAGPVAPLTAALVRKFWANGKAAPADKVATFLTRYASDARKAGQASGMFDAPSPADVLRAIDRDTFADLPDDLGPIRGFARPNAAPLPNTPSTGYEAGAASAEAADVDAVIRGEIEGAAQEGKFGPVYSDIKDDPEAAIQMLFSKKTGEVPQAMTLPEIGPIRFIWGSDTLGLQHILSKHGKDVLFDLPNALRQSKVVGQTNGRMYLEAYTSPKRRTVIRLDFDGDNRPWVLTSHDLVQGTDAQPGRTSNGLTDAAPPSVPDATARANDMPNDTADQDAIRAELDAARATLADDTALANINITLDDGSTGTIDDMLYELDQATLADDVVQFCAPERNTP